MTDLNITKLGVSIDDRTDSDLTPGEQNFIAMNTADMARGVLGHHHSGYHVGLRANITVDGQPRVVHTGNYKMEKGPGAVRICAEALLIMFLAFLEQLGREIVVEHVWLCAEPRPEADRNSRFGVRTPCDGCLDLINRSMHISSQTKWTLHNPCDEDGVPTVHLTMTTEVLLKECS